MSCSVLSDNDNISITKVCTKVCLSPKTQRSDECFIEVIPESTDETEKKIILRKILSQRCACMSSCFICAQLFGTLWTVAHQAALSMGFSRQEYWSGLLCPPLGDLPEPGIELKPLGGFFTAEPPGKPKSKADDCKYDKVIFQRQKI